MITLTYEEINSGWSTISILKDVKNEDYNNLVGKYYKNVYNNYKTDSDMEECFSMLE